MTHLCMVSVVLIALFVRCPLPAQAQAALLMGTVFDPTGNPIPGVHIFLVDDKTSTHRHTVTDMEGYFIFPELSPGIYNIQAYDEKFSAFQLRNISLATGDRRTLEIRFVLRAPQTVVTVYGETKDAGTIATTMDQKLVQDLPIPERSFPSLLLLTPGIVLMPAQQSLSNDREFSFNGQPTNANYFSVDGVSTNTAVGLDGDQLDLGQGLNYSAAGTTMNILPVDAINDVSVVSGLMPSTFGRQAGGHVQLTSRSGTSQFHGTASEYFRNSALDAADWFDKYGGLPRARLSQNNFGLTLGGPLRVQPPPKTNSDFFFFAYEGLRFFQPTSFFADVPTLNLRQSASPELRPYLDLVPLPNGPEDPATQTAAYRGSNSLPASADAFNLRLDHSRNNTLAVFARYNYSPSMATSTETSWNPSRSKSRSQSLTLGVTWMLAPHITFSSTSGYSKDIGETGSILSNIRHSVPSLENLLLPNQAWRGRSYSATYMFMDTSFTVASPTVNTVRQINSVNNLTITRGHHDFTAGTDWLSMLGDTLPDSTSVFVDFLSPASLSSGIADYVGVAAQDQVEVLQHNLSIYFRDLWHSGRLTIDSGLRWELNPAPRATGGQHLYTVNDHTAINLANNKSPLYQTTYTDFAPRLGIGYLLNAKAGHELRLRMGAGINYSLNNTASIYTTSAFPHSRQIGVSNIPFPEAAVTLSYPPSPKLEPPFDGQSFLGYASNYAEPKIYQWSIGLEQSLTADQILSAAYVGSVGRRLFVQQSFVDPNPNFIDQSIVTLNRSDAVSSYNSLQIQYKRRLSRGLEAIAAYTWAHSQDNASTDIPVMPGSKLVDLKEEWANSDFDLRNSFGAALAYDIPTIRGGKRLHSLLAHWGVSAFTLTRSSMPIDITYDNWIGSELFSLRPDIVPGKTVSIRSPGTPGRRIINPDAFAVPVSAHQGTFARNSLRGLPFWQVDFGLHRDIHCTEKVHLQWRGEFLNAFNHPSFGDPDPDLGILFDGELTQNPSFGKITSMLDSSLGGRGSQRQFQLGGSRAVQLALRLSF